MSKTVTIPIDPPLELFAGKPPIREAIVREPTYDEYVEFGDPYTVASSRDGATFLAENSEAIARYMRACIVEPNPLALPHGGFRLARKVKEAIIGFFLDAGGENTGSAEASPTSPKSFSSPATSPSPISIV